MRALFIGLGGIGQRHLRNLLAIQPDAEVSAYRVRRQQLVLNNQLLVESDSGLELKYGVRVFSELESALAERPEIAFVCNPTSLHAETALAAAEAGCHLFVEKPIAESVESAEALVSAVIRSGRVGLVGYQLRFHPCFCQMREWLNSRRVGRVVAVRAEVGEYLPGWHPYEDYRQMYASSRKLGGGVVLSQIHELDYLCALFGRPKNVFAIGGHLSRLEVDVEDVASILMECVNEAGTGFPVHLHQDYLQRPAERTCQVIGDAGKILVDFRTLTATLWDDTGSIAETANFPELERNELFLQEMKHFLACVEGARPPVVSLADGTESLRIALAARNSMETGKVIQLLPK
jgi:predicted dehydrogenase